jgi:glycosyltransferase involved in cell wall biosynthesis
LSERYPQVRPIHHAKNKGYGAALRTGLYAARNELIFFSDSDMQFDLNEIDRLLEYIEDHDIVAGYRAKRADPFGRRMNAWGWNMLVRMVLGVNVRDIDCAFKLFRRDVFAKIQLASVGAMINTELLARAAQQHMRIKEVPVSHYPRNAGQQTGANLRVIARAFRELVAMQGRLKPARSLPPGRVEGYEAE